MNVLLLTHRLPFAPNRGDRIRAYHLLRLLRTAHTVRLVSLVHDSQERAAIAAMRDEGITVTGVSVSAAINRLSAVVTLAGSTPLTHSLLRGADMGRILQIEAAQSPDVLVAYGTGMMQYAFSRRLADVPCVLDMVDVDSEKWEELAGPASWPMNWVYRREARTLRSFERSAVDRACATVVVSERERDVARRALGRQVAVISNGVAVHDFAPPDPPAMSRRIVFCGVFNYQPNEDAAVWLASHVWPAVKTAEPDAVLQLVGMNPSSAIRALASPGSIEVTGEVPDVRPYLWSAAAAAAPLFIARGVQNKVLEAVAAGLPCVVSPAVYDGLPEITRPGCIQCREPGAFSTALVKLLRMPPSQRRELSGHTGLEALTWPRQLQPFLTLIDNATSRRSRSRDHTLQRLSAL